LLQQLLFLQSQSSFVHRTGTKKQSTIPVGLLTCVSNDDRLAFSEIISNGWLSSNSWPSRHLQRRQRRDFHPFLLFNPVFVMRYTRSLEQAIQFYYLS